MNLSTSEAISNITGEILNVSNSSVGESPSKYAPYEQYVDNADNLNFYSIGIIIPFGLLGNIFSVCVFLLSPILRRTTTGQYLVALAIADSTFLVGQLIEWPTKHTTVEGKYHIDSKYKLNFHDTEIGWCMLTYFLRYGGGLWSSWLTIAIALERTIAVAIPLRVGVISTLRRARIVIAVITVISFGLSLFSFWVFRINKSPQCVYNNAKGYSTWNTVSLRFGTLVIPCVLISIITTIIIVLLYRARKKRMSQLTLSTGGKHYSNVGLSTETQLTLMLVAVNVAMIALKAPFTITFYYFNSNDPVTNYTRALRHVAHRVTEIFNVTNYAINFILYCLSGSSFREQIRKTFCRWKATGSAGETQQISLETPVTPQLGSNIRLLKTNPKRSSPSVGARNNI